MAKTLGIKKEDKNYCRFKIEPFEHEFMNFWGSLGFRLEKDKNSESYKKSVGALRQILKGVFYWGPFISLNKLKEYCLIFKDHSELNTHFKKEGEDGYQDLKKLYFHQFTETYSGYSYLRNVVEGKFKSLKVDKELEDFSKDVVKLIQKKIGRNTFSAGESARILTFCQSIDDFFAKNKGKIAFGVDKLTLVKHIYTVIKEFADTKGIKTNLLIYTGNYALGSALEQAMERFELWKIYSKIEPADASIQKDPEKAKKVMAKIKTKEEQELPDIVKKRREEMKKHGIELKKTEENNDCSKKEEFLRKKKEKRNPFSGKAK